MKLRWPLLLLLLLSACGDGLVDGSYRGEPYLQVSGLFRGTTGEATVRSPHLGILWTTTWPEERLESQLTPILASPLSSTFSFEVWDLPPRSALMWLCGAGVAIGTLVVYDDVNEDGRIEMEFDEEGLRIVAPDRALGAGPVHALFYTDTAIKGCEPFPDLDRGFHVLVFDDCWLGRPESPSIEVFLFPPMDLFPIVTADPPECGTMVFD